MADFKGVNKKGNYFDDWELHKNDYHVWRKFWALCELRRKWEWADWFYKQLDRTDDEIVAPIYWGIAGGTQYMKLCLWIALLKSVHEGLTEGLNSYDTPKSERVDISKVFPMFQRIFVIFQRQRNSNASGMLCFIVNGIQ